MPACQFHITGLVQGVFFRASVKEKADRLGLSGWVKNNLDGTVEVFAEGSDQSLREIESWCWSGPAAATVTSVKTGEREEEGNHTFEVRDYA